MNTIKIILRGWLRSPLSSTISLLSLAIGLLCSTILLLFAVTEFRMAKTLGDDPDVYFVEQLENFRMNLGVFTPAVNEKFVAAIADNYPEVIEWTAIGQHNGYWQYDEKFSFEGPFTISVTPSFTKFITIPMEEGCLDSVLAHPNAIAITRTYANQIFPGENPIGKTISGEQAGCFVDDNGTLYRENRNLVVEGIIDSRFRSFLNVRAIFSRSEDNVRTIPNSDIFYAIIKLKADTSPDDILDKILHNPDLYEKFHLDDSKVSLQKISDAYFEFPDDKEAIFKTRDKNTLIIGLSIALIVLIISVFNYLNITFIRAPKRLKNLAGQRIMGATKGQVATQIITETFFHVFVSFGLALLFMPDVLRAFNSFMGSDLQWQNIFQWQNLPYILMLLSILILIPAVFLIIKFNIKKPMDVFKNPTGNKLHYLGSFVVLQFIISVVLIAFSINVKREMDHILSVVPQAHQIVCIEWNGSILNKDFTEHIKQSATTTEYLSSPLKPNLQAYDTDGNSCVFRETEPNYFDFLRIPIVMGRTFDSIPSEIKQVVVNRSFVTSRGIEENPLGYEFTITFDEKLYRIVGVCEDFTTQNAELIIPPTLYVRGADYSIFQINIRYRGSLEDKINEIKEIFETYAEADEDDEYEEAFMPKIYTMADYYLNLNPEVNRLRIMVAFFAFISIFLSAIGLFGLSWYTVERRHKEMALRKVHGATTGKLLLLLCKTFFIWCALATIIALPMGYYISQRWLERFVYRIDNSLWTLLFTALIAATVTFLTVIFQTTRAARANPAKFIRSE